MQGSFRLLLWFVAIQLATVEQYSLINGYLCINEIFTQTMLGQVSDILCATLCTAKDNCQAFTLADGPCQLFVFDKCSKSVRNCGCTRRGQVFVKQRPGLQLGALCPSGFGDDLCGVKYKLSTTQGTWQQQLDRCHNEVGSLVMMSDVTNETEMTHLDSLYIKYSTEFWLGGLQKPFSPEPAGGWYWVECDIALDGSLWGSGEPDNVLFVENVVARGFAHTKLADVSDSIPAKSAMCECLSPFD